MSRHTEVEAINGFVVREARALGLPEPAANAALCRAVRAAEARLLASSASSGTARCFTTASRGSGRDDGSPEEDPKKAKGDGPAAGGKGKGEGAGFDLTFREKWRALRAELRRYRRGMGGLYDECREALDIVVTALYAGEKMTPQKWKHLQRTLADMFKLMPFAAVAAAPGGTLLIPLFAKYFPALLPSTFEMPTPATPKGKQKLTRLRQSDARDIARQAAIDARAQKLAVLRDFQAGTTAAAAAAAGAARPNLTDGQRQKLTDLFEALDANSDGVLDLDEFQKLGRAITGKAQSVAETKALLERADADSDCELGLEEWLEFSATLADLPENDFNETVERYTEEVKKLNR